MPGEIIWKLRPTAGGILVGESRDIEQKTMTLFAIRPSEGRLLFNGVKLQEPWWVALETTIGEVALLHSFPRPDLPSATGTTAIDCATGEVLWHDEAIRVLCGIEEIALVRRSERLERSALALVDVRTGMVLEEIGDDRERVGDFQELCAASDIWPGWINSNPLDEVHPRFNEISEWLARLLKEPRGTAEIAEYGRFTALGAHARSGSTADAMLANHVDAHLVVLCEGRPIFHETATSDAPAPGSDLFFIWNGMLVFIKERRTLAGINLNTL